MLPENPNLARTLGAVLGKLQDTSGLSGRWAAPNFWIFEVTEGTAVQLEVLENAIWATAKFKGQWMTIPSEKLDKSLPRLFYDYDVLVGTGDSVVDIHVSGLVRTLTAMQKRVAS